MSNCTYADVAFLVQAWPGTLVQLQAKWRVTITGTTDGDYSVLINGVPQTFAAVGLDEQAIRNGLLGQLTNPLATYNAFGLTQIDVQAVNVGTIESFDVSGPNATDIGFEQTGPSDNTEFLEFWLEQTQCFVNCDLLPKCAQPLYHAAWAAHKVFTAGNTSGSGLTASDFEEWVLGPAKLKRGASGSVSDDTGDLGRTDPGKELLKMQEMYFPPVSCGIGFAVAGCC